MSMKINYTDDRGVIQVDLSPSLPDRSAASSRNEIEYPKFDTVNNRFAQYDVFGGKRLDNIMAPSEKTVERGGAVDWGVDAENGQETRSLFSRSRYNSVEEELANIPYAFARDSISDINTDSNLNTVRRTFEPRDSITVLPDQDLEDNRFFNKNRAYNFKVENSLFGPQISYDNTRSRDDLGDFFFENDNLDKETVTPAFDVKQLIHAQDRYYDLSSKQSSIVNRHKNVVNIPKKVTVENVANSKKDSLNSNNVASAKKVGVVKSVTGGRTQKVVKISDSKVKSPVKSVLGRTDGKVDAFQLLPAEKRVKLPLDVVEPSQNPHKVVPTSKRAREHSFAILAERSPHSSRPHSPVEVQESRSGRVSPFKGRGFREHISQTNPRNSRANSPVRLRTNSLTEFDNMAQTIVPHQPILNLERPLTPKNYIKANMDEVHDISEFNREKNMEIAEQKRLEEEEAILIEMGIIGKSDTPKNARSRSTSRANSPNKLNLRSRSNSPSAVLQFEPIPKNSRDYVNTEDGLRKPTQKSRIYSVSKSQPHSKTGSPKHSSKIPKRQNSVSPTRDGMSESKGSSPKREPYGINRQSRFISNSTSSINESVRILPGAAGNKGESKSTQNLGIAPSILKDKPPRSPGKFGPPPTNRKVNAKRLSPIVGTPNRSSDENTPRHTGNTQKSTVPKTLKSNKTQPINKEPIKSNGNKSTSKTISRSVSREISPDKNLKSTTNLTKNSTQSSSQIDLSGASNKKIKSVQPPLKKATSKTNINSKPPVPNKPDMKNDVSRTNSMKSLSKTNSNKNLLDKPNLKKTDSVKSLKASKGQEEKIVGKVESNPENSKNIAEKSSTESGKTEILKHEGRSTSSDGISTQDGETQYDKGNTDNDTKGGKLIPLTKHNVVSMTTAAITSQPLEVAAKVTGQLPAAFEKAKEKGVFERKTSNDSIVGKTSSKEETPKKKDSVLEKKSSKSSLNSVKEGNLIFSSPVADENIKLKPLHPPLDPQIEKVKRKIDSILKSAEVGTEDISVVANDMAKEAVNNVAADAAKATDKIKSDVTKMAKEEGNKAVTEITSAQNELNKKLDNILTPIGNPSSNNITSRSEPKNNNIEPVVTIVNTKKPILVAEANERSTEAIVTGGPDVEVQSSNMSSSNSNITKNNKEKTGPISSNGGFPKSTSTTGNQGQPGRGLILPAKSSDQGSISSNTLAPKKDETKPPNICQRLVGSCINKVPCCGKTPCCNKTALDEAKFIDETIDKKKKESKKSLENAVKEKGPGLVSKFNCCKKNNDEMKEKKQDDIQKERLNASEIGRMAGSKKMDAEPGRLGKLFSCCACCKRKNKISDSSSDMEMTVKEKKTGFCSRLMCCKSNKTKQQDWTSRRDSILSEPAPKRCCGKCSLLLCCLPCSPCSTCCKPETPGGLDGSRRPSMFSKNKSMSPTIPPEDTRPKLDSSLVEHTSHMRGAIPVLPVPLAWFCLVCNVLVPGFGTVMSGLLCLCFGKPRFSVHDGPKPRLGAFVINLVVGAAQLFTVLFCLVGWGWSIWWGIIMIKIARKYKKLKQSEVADQERANVPPVTSNNHAAP